MENPNYRHEIDEAMRAGQQARDSLLQAKDCFSSAAGDWGFLGLLDLLGGRTIATIVRCHRMKDSDQLVQRACSDLKQFGKELTNTDSITGFHVKTEDFMTFADAFLDWFPMDWFGQTRSKIREAEKEVDDAIEKVEYILQQLGEL